MSGTGRTYRVVASDITIVNGDQCIVEGLSIAHEPGSIAWLSGPNGAGKSSLMRVLAGIDAPRGGTVHHEGIPPHQSRSGVAYYSPAMSLPPEPRAASFASLMSRLTGADIPLAPDRVLGRKVCRALSTGEEKRLLLGPILARGRPFVFLDEPYEHLSRDARAQLTSRLVVLAERSVVFVATNQPIPDEAAGPTVSLSTTEAPHVA